MYRIVLILIVYMFFILLDFACKCLSLVMKETDQKQTHDKSNKYKSMRQREKKKTKNVRHRIESSNCLVLLIWSTQETNNLLKRTDICRFYLWNDRTVKLIIPAKLLVFQSPECAFCYIQNSPTSSVFLAYIQSAYLPFFKSLTFRWRQWLLSHRSDNLKIFSRCWRCRVWGVTKRYRAVVSICVSGI